MTGADGGGGAWLTRWEKFNPGFASGDQQEPTTIIGDEPVLFVSAETRPSVIENNK